MKRFIAISAVALVLAPPTTTDAQLSKAPKRLRLLSDHENEWGHRDERQLSQGHRHMILGGVIIRNVEEGMSTPLEQSSQSPEMSMSMAIEMTVAQPTEPITTTTTTSTINTITKKDPCTVLTKKRCRKNPQCTWERWAKIECYTTPTTANRITLAEPFGGKEYIAVEDKTSLYNSARSLAAPTTALAFVCAVLNIVM